MSSIVLRLGVLLLFATETATTIMLCIGVHHQLLKVSPNSLEFYTIREHIPITRSADNALSKSQIHVIALVYAATGYLNNVTLIGVDWFFISRYYRLSGNKWIG